MEEKFLLNLGKKILFKKNVGESKKICDEKKQLYILFVYRLYYYY